MSPAPNIDDYLLFIYDRVGIKPGNLPTLYGTATDGSLTALVDGSQVWTADQWKGYTVLDQTQNVDAPIVGNSASILDLGAMLAAPILAGDKYLIGAPTLFATLALALELVHSALACASATLYSLAVYNLAADRLITYAVDVPGQDGFAALRAKYRLDDPSLGIVSASSNESTSMSYLNPEQMKRFTVEDLEMLKTPWGRRYIGIAQKYGEIPYGLT